ncbi:MAG: pitrilysin family protein [Armatimonadota bacterium]|nr:pitrilysin family protein [Armatimonadota bacterium]MDR7532626.1 pitrilysin family protein [Armatimonadota bacterium]MDR7536166.1 pitrilysin family protein [Armatimonadota bacterium]
MVLAAICAVLASPAAAPAPQPGRPPAPVVAELPNGLQVVVEEQPHTELAALYTWVRAGSRDEDDGNNGAAHFLEHMLFKGTARRPPGEAWREVDAMGGAMNASTSVDWTAYYIVAKAADLPRMLDIQADALLHSTLDADEVERERRVVVEEINRRDNFPGTRAFELLRAAAYTVHPYRRSVLGTRAGIERMSRDVLAAFYRTHYVPERMTVVVVGGVRAREALALVRRAYGSGGRAATPRAPRPAEPPLQGIRRVAAEQDVRAAYLAMGFPALSARDPDFPAAGVLAAALGAGLGGRLRQALVDRARVAQSVSAFLPAWEDPAIFVVSAVTAPDQAERAEAAIVAELDAVRDRGLSDLELQRARSLVEGEYLYHTHTVRGRAFDLGFAATVAGLDMGTGYLDRLRRVTADDVRRVAQRILDPRRYVVAVIRPAVP